MVPRVSFASLTVSLALQVQVAFSALSTCTVPIVTIKNGTYAGVYSPGFHQEHFLGMPFAQTTGMENRFKNPVPLNSSWTGIRNATAYSPFCPGYSESAVNYNADEDCLTVNVIRPTGYEGQTLPVAVWIFGGGFYAVRIALISHVRLHTDNI